MTYKLNTATDTAPVSVFTAGVLGGGVGIANAGETTAIETGAGFSSVDFEWLITNLGASTEFRFRAYFSTSTAPGTFAAAPEDWAPIAADDITTGLSTLEEYDMQFVVASFDDLAVLPASVGISVPARGLFMILRGWSEVGAPAGSSFACTAIRRTGS